VERELWPLLYHALQESAAPGRQKQVHYQPEVILAVLLWAAIHDRSVRWACRARHWDTTDLRPDEIPAPSTVSRRARRPQVADLLDRLGARLRGEGPPAWTLIVDGKPLLVGVCSKDPDARPGRVPGGFARGYKLHALWGARCLPEAWEVTPLNEDEGAVAVRLLGRLGRSGYGYLLADGGYDAAKVFDAAEAVGYQLVAPPEDPFALPGHRPQSAARRRCVAMFRDGFGRALLRGRGDIERAFGNAGSFGGGMGPLPAWARRLGRVVRWVWAKLVINAARILFRQQRLQQMQ
jgi:hypothetical protein